VSQATDQEVTDEQALIFEGYMLALQRVTGHVHFYGTSRYGMDDIQKREFCLQMEKWRPSDHPSMQKRIADAPS
jgi:hypothetical protein